MMLPHQKLIHPQHGPITKFAVKSTLPDPPDDHRYDFYITLPFLNTRSLGSQTPINTFLSIF